MDEFSKVQLNSVGGQVIDFSLHFKFLGYCNSERSYQEGYKCGLSSI